MLEDFGVGAVLLKLLETRINFVFFFLVSLLSLHNFTISIYQYFFTRTLHLILHSWEPRVSHPSRLDQALCRPCPKRHHNERSSRWRMMRGMKDLKGKKLCVMVSGCIMMCHDVSSGQTWSDLVCSLKWKLRYYDDVRRVDQKPPGRHTNVSAVSLRYLIIFMPLFLPMVGIAEWSNHKKRGIKIMRYRNECNES